MVAPNKAQTPKTGDALILVDVQKDFLPGGALAVETGDRVLEPLNQYIQMFDQRSLPIFATRCWHPAGHCSFVEQGGPWPPHCIQNSPGAEFADALQWHDEIQVVSKGTFQNRDAYSGFEGTDLDQTLQRMSVKRLWVGGLATDYCVLNTVRDACQLGYQVLLLTDGIGAVNVDPHDGDNAIRSMKDCGALITTLDQVEA